MKNHFLFFVLHLIAFTPFVQANDEIVWFVHGLVLGNNNFQKEINVLNDIYPKAEDVVLKKWDSPQINIDTPSQIREMWNTAVDNAEKYATDLVKEIQNLSPQRRDRLILIGHSLGARIVVRTSAILQKENVHIKKIILAGAAIDNDDPDIPATFAVSIETVENVVNPKDFLLGAYHSIGQGKAALGTGYLFVVGRERFREILMSNTMVHFGYVYFRLYRNVLKSQNYINEAVIVPQDYVNANFSVGNMKVFWNVIDKCQGWELQQNHFSGHFRIIDNNNERHAWGGEKKMKLSFERVKEQLNENKSCRKLPTNWQESVKPKQDYWNVKSSVTDGDVWWETLDCYKGWKLEKHRTTGHCRIIDPASYRRAWGGEQTMRESFDDAKKQIDDLFEKIYS